MVYIFIYLSYEMVVNKKEMIWTVWQYTKDPTNRLAQKQNQPKYEAFMQNNNNNN